MKTLLLSLLLLPVLAFGATITPLERPAGISYSSPYSVALVWAGFNADDSIRGSVVQLHHYPCAGHACSIASGIVWQVTWDTAGNATLGARCATLAGGSKTWLYAPGFDATSCPTFNRYDGVVEVNGYTVYYISTSADGVYELTSAGLVTL